ncbi:MAG: CCA tRNA nucleotidyltransferase [Lachnospiraceae bacterium]|nr:CCA tRNA nucleotidyltransferase [Candidatus Colinaster equi]
MIIKLPKDVKYIIDKLQEAGYEAYAVGGCVRDTILGRCPDDWDITTSAKPLQIKELFKSTIDTGIQHGTVTVMRSHIGYEVTTYRVDGEYEDNRHPKEVQFTTSLIEDLKRRDFTINAMAYNETEGLVDEFGGMDDLNAGIVRCVGEPMDRFSEDALRIMRAVRFSAQLGFSIDPETKEAAKKLHKNLESISAERINVELTKLLVSDHPDYILDAYDMGIMDVVLPEFSHCMVTEQNNPHHCYTVGEHIIKSMQAVDNDKVLRYTMLLHDIAKPCYKTTDANGIDHFHGHAKNGASMAHSIMRRLRFDNDTLYKVEKLVLNHDRDIETTRSAVRRAISQVGVDLFPLLLKVKQADLKAQSEYKQLEKQEKLGKVWSLYYEITNANECVTLAQLKMNGHLLIEMGIAPGPRIGLILHELLDIVLDNPKYNDKKYLQDYVKEKYIDA